MAREPLPLEKQMQKEITEGTAPICQKQFMKSVAFMLLSNSTLRAAVLLALVSVAFAFFTNPYPAAYFDLTFRLACSLLEGRLGLPESSPSWLNETVPLNGLYYGVFPLGSVICMLPFAALFKLGLLTAFPTRAAVALLASATVLLAFLLTGTYRLPLWRRMLFALALVFGTWLWPNLAYGGMWQIAIAFAVMGELGALVFILVYPRPFLAGACFALAFGNRTEIILTAPLFYFLLLRKQILREHILNWREWPRLLKPALFFSIIPVALGVLTLIYNTARFSSPFDFGYARIPGVLEESWYAHGIFSPWAIPLNIYHMLFEPWRRLGIAPWLVPSGWGGSVFLYSPFLLLLFRRGAKDLGIKRLAWAAIALLTLVLWLHGNPGGWQVSYRYGAILLPWALLILLESSRRKTAGWEPPLIIISAFINIYAAWLFCNTSFMSP
jgi:hypothetical protein